MQREILFRGKHISGRHWLIGSLVKFSDTEYRIVPEGRKIEGSTFHKSLVIPESVGQFTGLTDKQANKIFEGDILRISIPTGHLDNVEQIAKVVFENGCFRFEYAPFRSSIYDGYAPGCTFEIIGNLTDNPELLNTK